MSLVFAYGSEGQDCLIIAEGHGFDERALVFPVLRSRSDKALRLTRIHPVTRLRQSVGFLLLKLNLAPIASNFAIVRVVSWI